MKCLSCGFENPSTSKFCNQCGNILTPVEGTRPPSTRQPPTAGKIKTSPLAIASLVLGVCSFAGLWCLTGIPAIITGHIARRKIGQSGGALTGDGLALAGLIVGYTGTVMSVFVVLLLASIAVPNFIRARETTIANRCVNNMRLIQAAKEQFTIEHDAPGSYVPTADEIRVYLRNNQIPAEPTGSSYSINAIDTNPECNSGLPGHEL